MRILHCLKDDKFMDGTIRIYESDKRHSNEYVLVRRSPDNYSFRYLKSDKVKVIKPKTFLSMALDFDVVILHSFVCLKNYYIAKIPNKCKVVWYAWGVDIYGGYHPIVPIKLYAEETLKYLESNCSSKSPKNYSLNLLVRLSSIFERLWLKKAVRKVDYFSGVFPYEYDLIKLYHPYFKAKKVDFYYGDIDFFIKDTVSNDIEHGKVNVIIGNSADPRNNHHDALTVLSKIGLPQGSKVIMPLSYAGSDTYVKWVKEYAESLFPGRVKTLLEYMPLHKYLDLTSHCKVAIFYHERQQASDNIFMQMMYGAKVYMSETSLAYQYLIKEGFVVFSLQSDAEIMFKDISDEDVMKNRRLLCDKYASHTIIDRVVKISQQIEENINADGLRNRCHN